MKWRKLEKNDYLSEGMTSGHLVETGRGAVRSGAQQRDTVAQSAAQAEKVGLHGAPDGARAQLGHARRVLPSADTKDIKNINDRLIVPSRNETSGPNWE